MASLRTIQHFIKVNLDRSGAIHVFEEKSLKQAIIAPGVVKARIATGASALGAPLLIYVDGCLGILVILSVTREINPPVLCQEVISNHT